MAGGRGQVGQDGEDGKGGGSGMTVPPLRGPGGQQSERAFRTEIRRALRYEKGLAIKTAVAIILVAVMLLVHFYLFR
jgi:hypothetical protein